jgi:NAD(P)-dependent dehydrogenase (short-subunit alcohol dehydrogenase family)
MAFTVDLDRFRFDDSMRAGVEGKRVLITGAGKDGGLGQAFALAAGLNGAAAVGVHFHSSYTDGFDLVAALEAAGVKAFPLQADVTNVGDLWSSRSYVIEQFGGLPPNLVVCNSGLTEKGYSFGRALREVEGETMAQRRARVRRSFVDNLSESQQVLSTKIDGFLGTTHLWAGEAVYANEPLQLVYVSSRQAIDPGAAVPGYAISNWAVLMLPDVLKVNLGKAADTVSALSILLPFVRTGMTDDYADNAKVFGRWQPRMLETHEAAQAFLQLLARPRQDTDRGMFELMVDAADRPAPGSASATAADVAPPVAVDVTWKQVHLDLREEPIGWSAGAPLQF